jgi:DNA-binding IclR family transcriptional regulator
MAADDPAGMQTLSRGLGALTALNVHGPLTLAQLCHTLDLPRTTMRRIMDGLIAEGCCLRVPESRLYALAPGVVRLTAGYGDADRLTSAALDVLPSLSHETGWPCALAVPEELVMRVRLTTDHATPRALARMRAGYAAPQAETTTGLLFLASLDAADASRRLDAIYAHRWPKPLRLARGEAEAFIDAARRDGWLMFERRFPEGSLGVPLRLEGRVVGGLVLRYIRSAVPPQEVSAMLRPALLRAAAAIEAQAASGAVTGS